MPGSRKDSADTMPGAEKDPGEGAPRDAGAPAPRPASTSRSSASGADHGQDHSGGAGSGRAGGGRKNSANGRLFPSRKQSASNKTAPPPPLLGAAVIKSGNLDKRSTRGAWQPRFFALRGGYLTYDKQGARGEIGAWYDLAGASLLVTAGGALGPP